jgi:hypothetical protein
MPTNRNSIRNVLDGNYGFGSSAFLNEAFTNSAGRLATIENIVSNYRNFYVTFSSVDPSNPTNAEHLVAGDFAIQDILRDGAGNIPDSHNIEISNGTPSTYGISQGLFTSIPNSGVGAGLKHYYHTAQFAKAQQDDILPTTVDFAFGGSPSLSAAGKGVGTYRSAGLSLSHFRGFTQNTPTVSTTLTDPGSLFAVALTELLVQGDTATGYPHFDSLDEVIDNNGPISIGGYADGILTNNVNPGNPIDTQYI